jgi:hypothetical protein
MKLSMDKEEPSELKSARWHATPKRGYVIKLGTGHLPPKLLRFSIDHLNHSSLIWQSSSSVDEVSHGSRAPKYLL